jgi:hypothetical protein
MAFIRSYTAQGDPRARRTTMRAGRLYHSKLLSARTRRGSVRRATGGLGAHIARLQQLAQHARAVHAAGDPFHLRMPKFVRKLSLKKIASAAGKLGKFALPILGTALGGPLGTVAGALAQGMGGGGSAPAPELSLQPAPTGPPAQVSSGYQVSGTVVTPDSSGQVYNVFQRRRQVAEDEESYDDDDEIDDDEIADVGDEEEE